MLIIATRKLSLNIAIIFKLMLLYISSLHECLSDLIVSENYKGLAKELTFLVHVVQRINSRILQQQGYLLQQANRQNRHKK